MSAPPSGHSSRSGGGGASGHEDDRLGSGLWNTLEGKVERGGITQEERDRILNVAAAGVAAGDDDDDDGRGGGGSGGHRSGGGGLGGGSSGGVGHATHARSNGASVDDSHPSPRLDTICAALHGMQMAAVN